MILYIEDSELFTKKQTNKKLLEIVNSVKLWDIRLIYRNLLFSYTLIMNYQKKKFKKNYIPFKIASKI